MSRRIFLDIETLPPTEEGRERIARIVKREQPLAQTPLEHESLAKLIDERFRALALKAEYGRLLAIGIIIEDDTRVIHHGIIGRDRATRCFHLDEARTLNSFWRLIANFNNRQDLLIGHNILDFDLPFLCKRSVINRVRPSIKFCFRRFQQQPIYDTMWEWNNWRERISQHELAESFGIISSKVDGLDGSNIYDYFLADHHEEIARYCMRDVECVREIYYRINCMDVPPLISYEIKSPSKP
jgi:3'-5' exonuclease